MLMFSEHPDRLALRCNGALPQMSSAGYIFITSMLAFTLVVGSFMNGLCLLVFSKNKKLRTPTNMYLIALNATDLMMCLLGIPMAMTSAFYRKWMWGQLGCDIEAFIVFFLGLSSMYIIMAISVDRYLAISKPFRRSNFTKKKAVISCVVCYLFAFFWAILPAFGWNEYSLEGAGISCSVCWKSPDPFYMSYIVVIFFVCFLFPLVVMASSYYFIVATLRTLNKSKVWNMNSRIAQENLAIEKRVTKTAVLILVSFWVCWMPYAIVSFLHAWMGGESIDAFWLSFPQIVAKCQGILNPLVYVTSNKQLQKATVRLISCKSATSTVSDNKTDSMEELEQQRISPVNDIMGINKDLKANSNVESSAVETSIEGVTTVPSTLEALLNWFQSSEPVTKDAEI